MIKPKNAPNVIYWVEAKYPAGGTRRSRPMGGKFTRQDMAEKRAEKIREAGGEANIFYATFLSWVEMP